MSTVTAQVETLTAEVRTLVVGKRQVTLSVFAQLDSVPPGEIRPFGRVRTRDHLPGTLDVVGVGSDGSLVRSFLRPDLRRRIESAPPDGSHDGPWILFNYDYYSPGLSFRILEHDGVTLTWRLGPWAQGEPRLAEDTWTWASAAHRATAEDDAMVQVEELLARQATFREWSDLPLIVLAGLR